VRTGKPGQDTEIVVADVPGLVEGAAEGKGLGHRFLRHIERARVLVLLIDLSGSQERPPTDQRDILLDELRRYRPELLERPRVVVGSKCDVLTTSGDHLTPNIPGDVDLLVSSMTGEGLSDMLGRLTRLVESARAADADTGGAIVVHRPVGEGVDVSREDDGAFVVGGRAALRAVALSDLTDEGAVAYVQGRLRRLGVERALVRAGIRDGDTVRLGPLEFTYHRDESILDTASDAARKSSARARREPERRGRRGRGQSGAATSDSERGR